MTGRADDARRGRPGPFEDRIHTGLRFDGDHLLSLYDKAWFELDRGAARKAKSLLARAGRGAFAHDLAILDAELETTCPTARRNDPGRSRRRSSRSAPRGARGSDLRWHEELLKPLPDALGSTDQRRGDCAGPSRAATPRRNPSRRSRGL